VCPKGTKYVCELRSGEARYCLQEVFICDGVRHCKNGEDEGVDLCKRGKIATTIYDPRLYGNASKLFGDRDSCQLENYNQPVCNCVYNTRLECDDRQLTRIPGNVSPNVTRMYLHRNRIVLHKGDLDKYKKLTMINLNDNGIEDIPEGLFANQDSLFKLLLRRNRLTRLPEMAFSGAGSSLTQLLMDQNLLTHMPPIGHLTQLHFLNMSYNRLTLENYEFPECKIQKLHLDDQIRHITNKTFRKLLHLKTLFLRDNRIEDIAPDAFSGLPNLTELYLSGNRLTLLHRSWFVTTGRLTVLDLAFNNFRTFPEDGFHDLISLYSLDLNGLTIDNISETMWSPLHELSKIRFARFSDCAYTPRVKNCEPRTDGVSSMEHLLDTTVHKAMIWLIALMTVTGNLVVLWGRGFQRADDNKNVSVLICNLAVADLLMGIYLFVLAFKDLEYRGDYNEHAAHWRDSPLCVISGVLAMTSSEVAVMIMTFMSVDRFLAIVYPMIRQRASNHMSRTVLGFMSVIWTVGLIIALVPVFYWRSYSTFYGINGICFPLHVQRPDFVGWKYSAFIFLGINVFSLILIIGSYAAMFFNIQQTRRNTPLVVREVEVALRFFCIVATDCLCWTPIVVTKVLVLIGVQIPTELHAWIVVFVLPINSAVNPFLYTFTTTKFYSRIKTVTTKYSSCMPKGPRRESVNNTGSESVAFTQRHSLQVLPPTASEHHGPSPTPGDPLLVANNVADSKC
ncbi:relaxin receptor 2-like, partial [Amphibalanus amphitrite]|uniref:relaxin receptor 2-like n=1 Tax=Amphibalanus amphitrite TaxID=1232801 RepID=UPI001C9039E8